ncbi:dynamin-2A-like [Olea europaea subsp. europaea]|uniref:Dynamin-2A-like n=1 Tax=Olea europaea subsp. europaea TaxID=158383 RepID=A0A8S0TBC1_OLEEU|nr:dynamin-2A-like [Olea europaea subsp. europaea]
MPLMNDVRKESQYAEHSDAILLVVIPASWALKVATCEAIKISKELDGDLAQKGLWNFILFFIGNVLGSEFWISILYGHCFILESINNDYLN